MDKKDYPFKFGLGAGNKIIAALVLLLIGLILPIFVRSPYYLTLVITAGVGAILAMTFILQLKTGLVSMGIAVFWGIGAYTSTILMVNFHLSFWWCLPITTLFTALVSLLLGFVLIRNPGFSFVIMTMIIAMVFVVAVGSTEYLGGYVGIHSIPTVTTIDVAFFPTIEFSSKVSLYYLLLFLFFLIVTILAAFYSSSIGRAWTVIGLNGKLAESLGINTYRYRLIAFVLACSIDGLIGSYYAHFLGSVSPESFDLFKTIYVHVYAMLGGIQFPFLGPIVGSFLMVFFPEYMRITKEFEVIITGCLLVVLVIFLPTGILSIRGLKTLAREPVPTVLKIGGLFRRHGSGQIGKRET